jgi:phosphoribosylformylglycinamidine synthase
MEFTNIYDWPLIREQMRRNGERIPEESLNMTIFRNIVEYF